MVRRSLIALAILMVALEMCSCARESSESAGASDSDSQHQGTSVRRPERDRSEPSEAARNRGVVPYENRGGTEEGEPQIAVRGFTYEWRLEPEKGLQVRMDFVNTRDTYARARGYLFVVASSSTMPSVVPGVYPWDARFEEGYPQKYTDGNRLLFRDELQTRFFIPFHAAEGYYDHIKILVYREDGGLAIDLDYELDVTGEPSGPIEAAPMSVTM